MIEISPRRTASLELGEYARDVDNLRLRSSWIVVESLARNLSVAPGGLGSSERKVFPRIILGSPEDPVLTGNITYVKHPQLGDAWRARGTLPYLAAGIVGELDGLVRINTFIRAHFQVDGELDGTVEAMQAATELAPLDNDPTVFVRAIVHAGNAILTRAMIARTDGMTGINDLLVFPPDLLKVEQPG